MGIWSKYGVLALRVGTVMYYFNVTEIRYEKPELKCLGTDLQSAQNLQKEHRKILSLKHKYSVFER